MPLLIFVGERRSKRAIQIGARWQDGKLAAKQLFDALRANGIEPAHCAFFNAHEHGTRRALRAAACPIVALGLKAQRKLQTWRIAHLRAVHPAARGAIRRKETYAAHLGAVLSSILPVNFEP